MKYNAVIIGFGKAGKTLAAAMAKMGQSVAVIEKSKKMYGGTCINVGCIPSKSLVTSAAEAALHTEDGFEEKSKRYTAAIEEKRRVTAMLRQKNYHKLHDLPGVTIYDGMGRFHSSTEVEVLLTDGGTEVLEAERIFINTGSEPILPPIPGIQGNPKVYTSETLMEEERLPRRVVLIGAGYIGMEFASLYTSFGSEVTVIQDGTVFLPKEDRDVADEILAIQKRRGVKFLSGAKVTRVDGGVVYYAIDGVESRLEADAILLATGRRANTAALQAEKAGIALTKRGAVEVDELLRTSVPNIWAMGDCNGGAQFTFISLDDYRIVLSQLTGGDKSRAERSNVPYSVFMDTPLGRVGLTEQQTKEQGLPYKVCKLPTAAVPKAQVLRKTEGFLKAVIHAQTGEILGVSLLCPEAYEMVNTIRLAMELRADAAQLRDAIYAHPTMTEAFNDLFAL